MRKIILIILGLLLLSTSSYAYVNSWGVGPMWSTDTNVAYQDDCYGVNVTSKYEGTISKVNLGSQCDMFELRFFLEDGTLNRTWNIVNNNATGYMRVEEGDIYYIMACGTVGAETICLNASSPPHGPVRETNEFNITNPVKRQDNGVPNGIEQYVWWINILNFTSTRASSIDLNISDSEPPDGVGIKRSTVDFNLTVNSTYDFNCSLYLNDTFKKKVERKASKNNFTNFTWTFVDSNNSYYISCLNNQSMENTTKKYFTIDTVNPVISVSSTLSTNLSTFYGANSLLWWFNFSDENLYAFNVTIDGNTIVTNRSGITTSTYNQSVYFNPSEYNINPGVHELLIETSDSHTALEIEEYEVTKSILSKTLTYSFDEGFIKVEPITKGLFSTVETWKEKDRYPFRFERDFTQRLIYGDDMKFKVTSSHNLDILDTEYNGHIISYGLRKWIDFETESLTGDITLSRINEKEIIVTVTKVKDDLITFNSIGGLNVVNKTYQFYYGNLTETFLNQTLEAGELLYTLNISKNTSFVASSSASFYYNGTLYNPTKISTTGYDYYTALVSTDLISGTTLNESVYYFNWSYTINPTGAGYTITNNTNVSNTSVFRMIVSNCTGGDAQFDTINFTVYKDGTSQLVNVTTDALFTVWNRSSLVNRVYPFKYNSTAYPKACMYPAWATLNTDFTWQYVASGYNLNGYSENNKEINGSDPIEQIIYMVNSTTSTLITVSVVDEIDNELVGYTVEANLYDLGTNSYSLISSKITNGEGKAIFNLDVTAKEYQFVVKNTLGVIVYTEPKSVLTETAYILRVQLGTIPVSVINNLQGLTYNLAVDDSTNNFSVSWNDNTGLIDSGKLVVVKSDVNGDTILNTESSTNNVEGLFYNVSPSSGIYIGHFYVTATEDGNEYLLDSVSLDIREEYDVFGKEALFMSFFFVGTMAFGAVVLGGEIAIAVTLVGMYAFYALGFTEVALTGIISLMIAGLMIIIRIKRNRQ